MHELAGGHSPSSADGIKRDSRSNDNKEKGHWPMITLTRNNCWYCYHVRQERKKIFCKCKSCDRYLCVDHCFEEYHTTCHTE